MKTAYAVQVKRKDQHFYNAPGVEFYNLESAIRAADTSASPNLDSRVVKIDREVVWQNGEKV